MRRNERKIERRTTTGEENGMLEVVEKREERLQDEFGVAGGEGE